MTLSKQFYTPGKVIIIITTLIFVVLNYPQVNKERFTRIENEQGLPPGNVNDIVQDRFGFIWLGTESGLSRYDGYSFKIYKNEKNDTASLSHNNVFCLLLDDNDIIWVGTLGGGLNKFDIKTGKVKRYLAGESDNSISHNIIFKILKDKKGRLWISTIGGGVNVFDPVKEKFTKYSHSPLNPNSLSSNTTSALHQDKNGNIWIGTFDQGLNLYREDKNNFERFSKEDNNKYVLNHNQIMDIIDYGDNNLMIATFGGGINILDLKTKKITNDSNDRNFKFKVDFKPIRKILDTRDFLWIGSHHGLFRVSKNDYKITAYYTRQNDKKTLNNNGIREIFQDKSGLLWIGTNYGLNTHNTITNNFGIIGYETKIGRMFNIPDYKNMEKILWADLYKKTPEYTRRKISYPGNYKIGSFFKSKTSVNTYYDENGTLWIGNYHGLKYYDRNEKEFKYIEYIMRTGTELMNDFVKSFYFDSKGNFWAAMLGGGLTRLSPEGRITKYIHLEGDKYSLSDSRVMPLLEDSFGNFWVGTYGGLDLLDRSTGKCKRYNHIPNDNNSISNERILTIYETMDKTLWIGTYQGLNKFNRKSNNFEQYGTPDGLDGNTIYGILEDAGGNLWLSTNKGISKFNPRTKQFKNYNSFDGIADVAPDGSYLYKDENGQMFIGGFNGYSVFYPELIKDNNYSPPLVLTDLKIFDQEIHWGDNSILTAPLNEVNTLEFSYKDKIISLGISSLDYSIPSKNKYAYQIPELNDKWVYNDAVNRNIILNNLNPGKYRLIIKGSNSDGIWNGQTRTINLIINPPYWETWWFRLVVVLIVLLIIFIFYEVRLQRLLEIERTRTRIARNLHDEVGGTLASIQYFVNAIRKNINSESREKFLDLIIASSNEAQENIRDIIWTVNPEEDGLNKFLIKFNRYASDLFDTNEINYNITIPGHDLDKKIAMDQRQHLWCICKETVTNIVKHSKCQNVKISFEIEHNHLTYHVEDDGIGCTSFVNLSGNGIKNIENRANILKAHYSWDSRPGNGCKFTISFKI